MAVQAFDRTVLVRQASIVAGRLRAVMRAQRLVATHLILPRVFIRIAKGGGQAIAAMLQRGAAEPRQSCNPSANATKLSRLLAMSAATIDRSLRDIRRQAGTTMRRRSAPSAAIRRSVPVQHV